MSLSKRTLREAKALLAELVDPNGDAFGEWRDRARLLLPHFERASKPRRSVTKARKAARVKKQTRKEARADVRAQVVERAAGHCECGCGTPLTPADPGELDHFFGRVRAQESVYTTWLLARACHRQKTDNAPSPEHWLRCFTEHCGDWCTEMLRREEQAASDAYADAYGKAMARLDTLTLKAQQAHTPGRTT